MSNSIPSVSPTPSWERIKETALKNENLNADIRVGDTTIEVNAPSIWQRCRVMLGFEKAPVYAGREETVENLREQFGLDFSQKLNALIKETQLQRDSEEYGKLVDSAMQSFGDITQKLTTTITTSTASTSQAIQEAHHGALTSLAWLRQQFAKPQMTPQFCKTSDGKWSVLQPAPHLENFVLSGGGVKGAGYVGWFKAAEQFGALKNLKRIAGSSAGAMTAALIASGMNAQDLEEASKRTNFWSVLTGTSNDPVIKTATKLETKGWLSYFSFSGTYAVDRLNQEMIGSVKKYFKPFKTKEKFEESLQGQKELSTEDVESLVSLYQKVVPPAPHWLFGSLFQKKQETYMLTFKDLATLAKVDPRFKELTITGYDKDKQKEIYFNAQTEPALPIAEAVRGSMALPVVFAPAYVDDDKIIDGGVGSNIPAEVFKKFPQEKTVVLEFENDGRFNQTVYQPKEPKSAVEPIEQEEEQLEEVIAGNPNLERDAQQDQQKLYDAGPNASMVGNGDLEIGSFTASSERIHRAQYQAEIRTEEGFSLRQNQAVDHLFNSLEEAMKTMSIAELNNIIKEHNCVMSQEDSNMQRSTPVAALPIATESRSTLPRTLSQEDYTAIVQAAERERVSRTQSELPL